MKRRDFITLLGGAAAAWPLAARAQTLRHRPLVGSLQVQSLTGSARYASEFLRGMAESVTSKGVTSILNADMPLATSGACRRSQMN